MANKITSLKNQATIVFNSPILANLNPAERYELLQLCHKRRYKEGEFVFFKNDPGTGIYFIEDGRIELTLGPYAESDEDNNAGIELEKPNNFGALSIGYNLRRKSSARCLTDCILLGFFKPDFEVLKERHPKIAVKFLQTLSNISLRQLETTAIKLAELTDEKTALEIQFKTYYEYQSEDAD